eukprot:g13962.t1
MSNESSVLISNADLAQAVDVTWLFICFVLVLLMQAGFACYEVGAIRAASSTQPILLKNVGDAAVSFAAWYLVGNSIAFGTDILGAFGRPSLFLTDNPSAESSVEGVAISFLQFLYAGAFATTCTTIVSGAVADRIPFKAYIVYSFLTSALFYPLLAHWVWAEQGWASSVRDDPWLDCGVVDYAGSGVVHMLGGGISHFISRKVKSRPARFFKAGGWDRSSNLKNPTNCRQLNETGFRANDPAWTTLGCFLLWLGWYGFNCGSTLEISTVESQNAAGRAAVNTTLGAGFGGIFSVGIELVYHLWSPAYRKGKELEDPLYEVDIDVDDGNPADRAQREARQRAQLSRETLTKILKVQEEHPGSLENPCEESNLKWPHPDFKWPFSTHKDLHSAAINGVLAGLVGITADDAVSAAAVHFVAGGWGLVAAGFTAVEAARLDAGYPSESVCGRGLQTLVNFLMAVIIALYAIVCTWIVWGVFGILKLGNVVEAGKLISKAEDEGIAKLKDDIIRRDLAVNRHVGEKEEKIEFQMEQLVNRVDTLDSHRLSDVEARLLAGVQDIAGIMERVKQLESHVRNTPPSILGRTLSPDISTQRQDYAAQKRAPVVPDLPRQQPSAQSTSGGKSCRVS